jgi:hypothetical protein
MDKYTDSFNKEEFDLFRKYNNGGERSQRHIDTYTPKDEEDYETVQKNYEQLVKDTIKQMQSMPKYFNGDIDETD